MAKILDFYKSREKKEGKNEIIKENGSDFPYSVYFAARVFTGREDFLKSGRADCRYKEFNAELEDHLRREILKDNPPGTIVIFTNVLFSDKK